MVGICSCNCALYFITQLGFFPGVRGNRLKYAFSEDVMTLSRQLNLICNVSTDHFHQLLQCTQVFSLSNLRLQSFNQLKHVQLVTNICYRIPAY